MAPSDLHASIRDSGIQTRLDRSSLPGARSPVPDQSIHTRMDALLASEPRRKLVVLDDDPTGTQTVHDVPVLTTWETDTLRAEFARSDPCFFILTNSRSLDADAAGELNRTIARNLLSASSGLPFSIVSRSDSTLRGHFPIETDVLDRELGPFDGIILFPYFHAGGRYTIGDVHYVAEGDLLVPAAETPFAQDAAFGYRNSNLRDWIEEKTAGRVLARDVVSIGLDDLRARSNAGDPVRALLDKLLELRSGRLCVVNACDPQDAAMLALGSMLAEQAGGRYLYRTAAQFISARLGMESRLLGVADVSGGDGGGGGQAGGGLVIVGSHVPKTTAQLEELLRSTDLELNELDVNALLSPGANSQIATCADRVNRSLASGRDVVIATSRTPVRGLDASASLEIGRKISAALVTLTRRLDVRPRFFIAKGGITSSDLATEGLGVRRAVVRGQLLPGVPVWELGGESRFPGLRYVVFPGNVGGRTALSDAVRMWSGAGRQT
jgi:uncharacterized protein YgbK (DUF1537 family)